MALLLSLNFPRRDRDRSLRHRPGLSAEPTADDGKIMRLSWTEWRVESKSGHAVRLQATPFLGAALGSLTASRRHRRPAALTGTPHATAPFSRIQRDPVRTCPAISLARQGRSHSRGYSRTTGFEPTTDAAVRFRTTRDMQV